MGFIQEEKKHEYLDICVTIMEKEKDETIDSWKIISLNIDSFENYSPKDLRNLGRWLINEGKRIGKEYKSNGAKRNSKIDNLK